MPSIIDLQKWYHHYKIDDPSPTHAVHYLGFVVILNNKKLYLKSQASLITGPYYRDKIYGIKDEFYYNTTKYNRVYSIDLLHQIRLQSLQNWSDVELTK